MAKTDASPMKITKYEMTRMIGSRALQISHGAPILIKLNDKDLEELKYNPIEIAKKEYEQGVIPMEVIRPALENSAPEAQ
jgi:DNA-directed RNA polymerase subunit K/omega